MKNEANRQGCWAGVTLAFMGDGSILVNNAAAIGPAKMEELEAVAKAGKTNSNPPAPPLAIHCDTRHKGLSHGIWRHAINNGVSANAKGGPDSSIAAYIMFDERGYYNLTQYKEDIPSNWRVVNIEDFKPDELLEMIVAVQRKGDPIGVIDGNLALNGQRLGNKDSSRIFSLWRAVHPAQTPVSTPPLPGITEAQRVE